MPETENVNYGNQFDAPINLGPDGNAPGSTAEKAGQKSLESLNAEQKQDLNELNSDLLRKKIIGYLRKRFGSLSEEDAEDATQESLFKAADAIIQGKFRRESKLSSWVITIAERTAFDKIRRSKSRLHDSIDEFGDQLPGVGESPLLAAEKKELLRYIALLPARKRKIMELLAQDYTYEEIAEELGVNVGTAKSQAHKAKAKLKEMMTKVKLAA